MTLLADAHKSRSRETDTRSKWIRKQGGRKHVGRCLSFAVWFCQQLVDASGDGSEPVTGSLALGSVPELFGTEMSTFMAHWSDRNVLTLAIDVDCFWQAPLGAEALSILVHEAGHARAMHHGKGFVDEVERLAGVPPTSCSSAAARLIDVGPIWWIRSARK
jgi:hypothetical protein